MPADLTTTGAIEPLWVIESELESLLDSVDVCEPELLPELERRIQEYVAKEVQKVDGIHAVLTRLEQTERNAKSEIERLKTRAESAARASERLKRYVLRILAQREGRPLKGINVTFSSRRSESLVIDDPNVVPDEFKRTTVTIDVPKDPIKRALKDGREIAGVRLEVHEHLVRR